MAAAQVAAVLLLTLLGAYALPRGVDPSQAAHYEGKGGTFTCLDGSKTIPLSQVNDNYCDCPSDGSDEPGSSACYWGKFYCANRGHQPQFLSASFVDDGICDCCDGTDELVGCRNTCLDKGATERQVVRDKAEQMKRSLETKQRLISDGVNRRAGWSTRAASIDTEIAQLEKEVARIEDEKTAAQAAADEDRKRLQQEEEERQRQASEAQAKAAEDAVQAAGATGDATGAEETDEERGRRIASQWTNDPDAAGVPSEGKSEVIEGDVDDTGHLGQEEYEGHHDYTPTPPGDYAHSPSHHHQHIYSPLDSKVYQLNTDLSAAKRKLQELTDEKKVIQRYHSSGIKFDYGPGDNFLPLAGRCISDVGARWTYEACFFDAAIQKEPHNPNNKVSLGTWRGWDNDYTEAVFDNGDPCAGAPNRSLRVKLLCGDEERMYGGEEPATCLYTVSLTTPLACNQSDLDKEHAKLAELERFEAEIRAEIETAEKAKATAAGDRTEL